MDAFLVSSKSNVRYLSGYDGTNGLVVLGDHERFFLTDFRYREQAKKQVVGFQLLFAQRELIGDLPKLSFLHQRNLRLGFEASHTSYNTFQKIKSILPHVLLVPTEDLVESLSMIKDKDEIAKIRRAAQITDTTFSGILSSIRPKAKEKDLASEIEHSFRKLGGDGPAFETIVASGRRSAMPHGRASDKRIKKGELVTLDMGAAYRGYVSDMTRTLVLGKATPKQKKIYDLVLAAQRRALSKAKAGIVGMKLDRMAREIIEKGGYGKYFGHGLGHGLGLEVHCGPSINSKSKTVLKPGMVVTIEPGIYLPGWGGIRIEDDILITEGECEILTKSPKDLIEIR